MTSLQRPNLAARLPVVCMAAHNAIRQHQGGPRSRSRPSFRMRFKCANRISIFLRSCRDCSKPSVPANDRATSRACSWTSRGILRDGSFGQHCGLSGQTSQSRLLARYRSVLPSCTVPLVPSCAYGISTACSLFVLIAAFGDLAYFERGASGLQVAAVVDVEANATLGLTRASVPAAKVADTKGASSTQWCRHRRSGHIESHFARRCHHPASIYRTQGYVARCPSPRPASSASEQPRKRYPRQAAPA
jgi:hypothetical protein